MGRTHRTRLMRVRHDAAEFLPEHLQHLAPQANWLQNRVARNGGQQRTDAPHLMYDYLEREIGKRQLGTLLPYLLSEGYIERFGNYEVGDHAYQYGFGPRLVGKETRELLLTDESLLARLAKCRRRIENHWTPAHRHLKMWLMEATLDLVAGFQAISGMSADTVESVLACMHTIADGEDEPVVCRFGRFHSAVTRLKREARPHLSINGKGLVNIDIANSQPLFLGLALGLATAPRMGHQCTTHGACTQLNTNFAASNSAPTPSASDHSGQCMGPQIQSGPVESGPTIRPPSGDENCRKSLVEQGDTNYEFVYQTGVKSEGENSKNMIDDVSVLTGGVGEYMRQCQTGELYGTLMKESGWTGSKNDWKSDVWFQFLFGPPVTPAFLKRGRASLLKPRWFPGMKIRKEPADYDALETLARTFGRLFPEVDRRIRAAKKEDYKELPREMQRRESALVIGVVVGRLAREFPSIPIITIHDSIMTTPEHVDTILRLLFVAFAALGVTPTLRVEDTDEVQAKAA